MKKMLRITTAITAAMMIAAITLPATAENQAVRYVNTGNTGKLNMRKTADPKGKVVERLTNQTAVTVLDDAGEWVYVKVGKQTGYVLGVYLSSDPAEQTGAETVVLPAQTVQATAETPAAVSTAVWPEESTIMYVQTGNSGSLRLRKEPNSKAKVLDTFKNGTPVVVTGRNDTWAAVTVNGRVGYMQLSCLTSEKPAEEELHAVNKQVVYKADYDALVTSTMFIKTPKNGSVTLRETPKSKGKSMGSFPTGTPVRVISVDSDWVFATVQGMNGYLPYQYLSTENPVQGKGMATVINDNGASYVNLRSVKTMKGDDTVLTHVKVGSEVQILKKDGNWYYVAYKDYVGYIHQSFIVK